MEKKEEKLKGGIYITPKDIQVLNNCNIQQARIEHRTVRDILGVDKKKLTVLAYCEYYKLDYELVISYINPYR
ncbi:MAG: hypothetical protein R2780_01725 [Crocinitomicaceae bacterium]